MLSPKLTLGPVWTPDSLTSWPVKPYRKLLTMPAPSKPVYPTANPRLLSSVSLFGSWPGNWGKPPM